MRILHRKIVLAMSSSGRTHNWYDVGGSCINPTHSLQELKVASVGAFKGYVIDFIIIAIMCLC